MPSGRLSSPAICVAALLINFAILSLNKNIPVATTTTTEIQITISRFDVPLSEVPPSEGFGDSLFQFTHSVLPPFFDIRKFISTNSM